MLEPPELGPRLATVARPRDSHSRPATARGSPVRCCRRSSEGRRTTFATLWNLTQALGPNLDDLVATEPVVDDAPVEVLDRVPRPA